MYIGKLQNVCFNIIVSLRIWDCWISDLLSIFAYSDANWALNIDDQRSVAAYCVFLGHTLVSWSSKKQIVVARSSTEFEYRALAHASAEIISLRQLLSEIGMPSLTTPILQCNNLSVGVLAANPVFHADAKHIEIDMHFVRDQVLSGLLRSLCPFCRSTSRLPYKTSHSLPVLSFVLQTRGCWPPLLFEGYVKDKGEMQNFINFNNSIKCTLGKWATS